MIMDSLIPNPCAEIDFSELRPKGEPLSCASPRDTIASTRARVATYDQLFREFFGEEYEVLPASTEAHQEVQPLQVEET